MLEFITTVTVFLWTIFTRARDGLLRYRRPRFDLRSGTQRILALPLALKFPSHGND